MQTIVNKHLELTSENYPLSILLNERKDVVLLHATTEITLWNEDIKWKLKPAELLEILKQQTQIEPFSVAGKPIV